MILLNSILVVMWFLLGLFGHTDNQTNRLICFAISAVFYVGNDILRKLEERN